MSDSSLFGTAINVFASPAEAFDSIRERPRPLFPLALLIAGLVTVNVLYLNLVDLDWFIENQLRASPAAEQMSEEQIRQAVEGASISPAFLSAIGAVTSSLFISILYAVFALYLWIASSVAKHGIAYGPAFALVCWCSLPGLLGFLAAAVNLLTNDVSFMPQYLVNPLSFAALFGLEPGSGSPVQQALMGLDLTFIWSMVLLVLGYQAWSRKSLPVAAAIVLAPPVLLIGFLLFRSMG